MIWPLLGSSEASLGLLRSASWAAQKKLKTWENAVFELPGGSGRAAALPGPRRDVPGAPKSSQCWDAGSYHWYDLPTSQLPSNPEEISKLSFYGFKR